MSRRQPNRSTLKLHEWWGTCLDSCTRIRQSVLGIGFGAGVSAGTFTRYPAFKRSRICEIEPIVPPTSTRYFAREDYDVLHKPADANIY